MTNSCFDHYVKCCLVLLAQCVRTTVRRVGRCARARTPRAATRALAPSGDGGRARARRPATGGPSTLTAQHC